MKMSEEANDSAANFKCTLLNLQACSLSNVGPFKVNRLQTDPGNPIPLNSIPEFLPRPDPNGTGGSVTSLLLKFNVGCRLTTATKPTLGELLLEVCASVRSQ